MAREEQPREDLMREATALLRRIEFTAADGKEPIVCGFRRDNAFSLYFGEDPVYQFNAAGALRRGYREGRLIKAESRRLVSLTRNRTGRTVELVRHDFTAEETTHFLQDMNRRILLFREAIEQNNVLVHRQSPPNGALVNDVLQWLRAHPNPAIAEAPNVG